jgi:hypothetical protein
VVHNPCGLFTLQLLACSPLQWRAVHVQRLGTLSTPWGNSMQEMLENIFDCLYCVFRVLENKERLVKAEGVEFMLIMQQWPPPMQFQASYTHNIWYPFGCGWDAVLHKQPWPPPVFRGLMYEEDKVNDLDFGDIHVSMREGAPDGKVQLVIPGDGVQVWIPPWPSFSGVTLCVKCSVYTPLLLFDNQGPQQPVQMQTLLKIPWQPHVWKFWLSSHRSLVGTIGSIDFSFEENDELVDRKETVVTSQLQEEMGSKEHTTGQFQTLDKPIADNSSAASVIDGVNPLTNYRRARGLCDRCAEKWFPGHKGASGVQLHAIEKIWDMLRGCLVRG